jgi:hypothetical protein
MQVNYHLQDCTFAYNRQPWIDRSVVASFLLFPFLSYLTLSFPLSSNILPSTFSTSTTSANGIYLQPANLNLPQGRLPLPSARCSLLDILDETTSFPLNKSKRPSPNFLTLSWPTADTLLACANR